LSVDEKIRAEYERRYLRHGGTRASQIEGAYVDGTQKKAVEVTRNLKALGLLTPDQISAIIGLSTNDIEKL
jgi:hypothetical protein